MLDTHATAPVGGAAADTAPKTSSPGAARETCDPVSEKKARSPDKVEAPIERPIPPRPFDPTGCNSAAGNSTGSPSGYSLPADATSKTS